ncbi:MAG: hypothetical protein AAGB06_00990 [Verrucomicrobiota bacterium]
MKIQLKGKSARMVMALAVGIALNGGLLLIVGGFTVYRFVAPKQVSLKAPSMATAVDVSMVKYNQQQSKERLQNTPEIQLPKIEARAVSSINAPEITFDFSDVAPSARVSAGSYSYHGDLNGLSAGGLRMGVSAVDFFGIHSNGERIVIILDIARSMLDPRRGDIPGFIRVKERLNAVVDGLSSATLFNVMVFSEGLDVMSPSLILANRANKELAASFIEPYWKATEGRISPDAKRSVYQNNYLPDYGDFEPKGGSSRMDMALLAAFEQDADAIFLITDGTPSFTRGFTPSEQREYDRRLAEYEQRKANTTEEELAEYHRKRDAVLEENRRKREALKKAREEKGLDGVVSGGGSYGYVPAPWGAKPRSTISVLGNDEFVALTKSWAEIHYGWSPEDFPTLNIIGYSIPEEGSAWKFLNKLRGEFPESQFLVIGEYGDPG